MRPEDRLARGGPLVELLRPVARLFGVGVALRNAAYDRGLARAIRVDAPVVCVGNITTGGTGKTPCVEWVVRVLAARGRRPGVLSRGYRASRDERTGGGPAGDEARMLGRALPGVALVQDPDRVRGARELLRRGCDSIVLDDGFQHRRLARDLDLVLVDATRPFGLPWRDGVAPRYLLPRGLLREPLRGLARAHACVLTRCDLVDAERAERIAEQVRAVAPGLPIVRTAHRPRALVDPDGERFDLERLAGAQVDLVSGIGNADAFEATVVARGARVGEHRRFGDHHDYVPSDLVGLGGPGRFVVTTAKDAVKLEGAHPALFVLEIGLEVLEGRAVLDALLDGLSRSDAQRRRASLHEGLHG